MLKWNISKSDYEVVDRIAVRAHLMAKDAGIDYPVTDANMDITATHLNCCKLKLRELASAPNFDFSHDVFGIRRHLNRETGQLEDCFQPRFADLSAEGR